MNPVDLAPPQVTPGPEIDSKGIFARANFATCGYVSGNAGEKSKNPHIPPTSSSITDPLSVSLKMSGVIHLFIDCPGLGML